MLEGLLYNDLLENNWSKANNIITLYKEAFTNYLILPSHFLDPPWIEIMLPESKDCCPAFMYEATQVYITKLGLA